MRAIVIEKFGTPDVFKVKEIDKPKVIDHHVLIKVEATSVNPIDCKIRSGLSAAVAPVFPAVLHGDVAGTVVAVGNHVHHLKEGDQVYGWGGGVGPLPDGALTEIMLARADTMAIKPKNLTMIEAAALPLVSLTAYQGLVELVHLKAHKKVLIHGGTGGVGHIALQIAKILEATTYVTCSSEHKMGLAFEMGADFVINYKNQEVNDYVMRYTNEKGFDVIFDTFGGENIDKSLQAAALCGHVVTTIAKEKHDMTPIYLKGLSFYSVNILAPLYAGINPLPYHLWLRRVAEWVENNQLKPLIDKEQFTFDQVGEAHAYFESKKNVGKVVLIQSLR